MTIPAVMFIEMAQDMLSSRDPKVIASETKEFFFLGNGRMAEICDGVVKNLSALDLTRPPRYIDMLAGYLIGIETARALLATMPVAVKADVSI